MIDPCFQNPKAQVCRTYFLHISSILRSLWNGIQLKLEECNEIAVFFYCSYHEDKAEQLATNKHIHYWQEIENATRLLF